MKERNSVPGKFDECESHITQLLKGVGEERSLTMTRQTYLGKLDG